MKKFQGWFKGEKFHIQFVKKYVFMEEIDFKKE